MNLWITRSSTGRLMVITPAGTCFLILAIAFALGIACTAWGLVFFLP